MQDKKRIEAIERRNEAAICDVMDKYSPLLWSVAAAVLQSAGSASDVEECVADAFIHLWENPEKFDPGRGTLKSWLVIIVRSRAIDRRRELTKRSTVPLDDMFSFNADNPLEDVLQKEKQQALAAAVNALHEPEREILLRRYCCDQKPREIALAMGITVRQVDNHLYRTKKLLRRILSDEKGETIHGTL